jgi:general stress protein 13
VQVYNHSVILIIGEIYDIIFYCVKMRKKYNLFRSVTMSEKFEVGAVVTGKVTGIQPYGAFVALDESTQGLVHISEITHGYVKDINEHLKVGDEVQVKVLSVDEAAGKIGLSIRATEEAPERPAAPAKKAPAKKRQAAVKATTNDSTEGFNTLKDKLQEWIEQSEREDLIKK